jgi:hypothetical protein
MGDDGGITGSTMAAVFHRRGLQAAGGARKA